MAKLGRPPDVLRHRFKELLESPSGFPKFKRIMARLEKEDVYLRYFQESLDRAIGKAEQAIELTIDDSSRPTTDSLIETLTVLRKELDDSRAGIGMEKAK